MTTTALYLPSELRHPSRGWIRTQPMPGNPNRVEFLTRDSRYSIPLETAELVLIQLQRIGFA